MSLLNPGRWVLYGVLAISVWFGVLALDQSRQAIGYDKAQAEYAAQASQADAKREALAQPIAAKETKVQEQIKTITKTLIQKVPVYVKADACPLPGGFRLLHDAAATNGPVPDSPGLLDAAAVPAAVATETTISNYGTYHETAARLAGLQAWVRAQEGLK